MATGSRKSPVRGALVLALTLLAGYLAFAYVIAPVAWRTYEGAHHPAVAGAPKVTANGDGIPGDPLNVGLVGDRAQVVAAMLGAGWQAADLLSVRSSVAIAESVVLDRPDPTAPVSNLYVFGRKQDLAFEKEVGDSADRRHHVRWWQADGVDDEGRPLWVGGVSFDAGSGLSHRTGQITHHIDPDLDRERDGLMADLQQAGWLVGLYDVPGVGPTQDGTNAGGDRYVTDGRMTVGVLAAAGASARAP